MEVDMNAEIEKLLGEPSKLDAVSGTSKRSNANGNGLRLVGGRMRRFTESAAVSSAKHSAIHEDGDVKLNGGSEVGAELVKPNQGSLGKSDDLAKGGKVGSLVKPERLPLGKNSRHSRTGLRGLPKKGGAGGKCVWGKPGCELAAQYDLAALDNHDPNYDSNEEDEVLGEKPDVFATSQMSEEELVTCVDSILKEFLQHANLSDCIDSLGELSYGKYVVKVVSDSSKGSHKVDKVVNDVSNDCVFSADSEKTSVNTVHEASIGVFGAHPKSRAYLIVREAVLLSFERHAGERELVSQLLAELAWQQHLDYEDFACGFESVLRELADLRTDCPEASKWTGMFLARAIDDQVLQSEFLSAFQGRSRSSAMTLALETCATLLNLRKRSPSAGDTRLDSDSGHGSGRSASKSSLTSVASSLSNVWGVGGGTRPVESLVREIRLLVDEFVVADDFDEALRCVRELDVPHFHHELVYQTLLAVLESAHSPTQGAQVATRLCTLLRRFADAGVLSMGALDIGFRRMAAALPDLELDVPCAAVAFQQFVSLCQYQSFVPRNVVLEVTACKGARKRFMSEADALLMRG